MSDGWHKAFEMFSDLPGNSDMRQGEIAFQKDRNRKRIEKTMTSTKDPLLKTFQSEIMLA
jgi:hypothetical protein